MSKKHQISVIALTVTLWAYVLPTWPQQAPEKIDCWKQHRTYEPYVRCIASQMEPIDSARRKHFGEEYGAEKYLKCALTRPPGDTYCDRHRLKRRPEPEYWPNVGNVAPPKWPKPPKESVYRKGMKPKEYFDALCKAEAGEFIFKTVENVEGVYQIRPRLRASPYELRDRYVMEDPYGYTDQEASDPELIFVGGHGYRFFETPRTKHARLGPDSPSADREVYDESYFIEPPVGVLVTRYSGFDRKNFRTMVREFDRKPRSRYGYTWRGISRLHDRDLGIAGGEVAIVDLETNEVLALWRGFAQNRARTVPGRAISWETAPACPALPAGKFPKDFILYFVTRVLRPTVQ